MTMLNRHVYTLQCNIFVKSTSAITSPKWKVSCIQYERCNEGVIEMGTCPEGTFFDQYADPQDCYDITLVEDCNIDECFTQTHNCDEHALCTDLTGTYSCSCNGNFIEFQAGEGTGLFNFTIFNIFINQFNFLKFLLK